MSDEKRLSESTIEELGQMADSCGSILALQGLGTLPADMKLDAAVGKLKECQSLLQNAYVELTNYNPWDGEV